MLEIIYKGLVNLDIKTKEHSFKVFHLLNTKSQYCRLCNCIPIQFIIKSLLTIPNGYTKRKKLISFYLLGTLELNQLNRDFTIVAS